MTERPILFSGPMVRAILAGTKTQTRRVVKQADSGRVVRGGRNWHLDDPNAVKACPYGQPGDRLWVRETFVAGYDFVNGQLQQCDEDGNDLPPKVWYRATDRIDEWWDGVSDDGTKAVPWKPSIHMARGASRITLEVTGVRVERLQDISEDDAKAEGVSGPFDDLFTPRIRFEALWDSLNSARGHAWDANPWVWAISFKRIDT